MANDKYIGQLDETFATSLPSRVAAFFAEPIQVPATCVCEEVSMLQHNNPYSIPLNFLLNNILSA